MTKYHIIPSMWNRNHYKFNNLFWLDLDNIRTIVMHGGPKADK